MESIAHLQTRNGKQLTTGLSAMTLIRTLDNADGLEHDQIHNVQSHKVSFYAICMTAAAEIAAAHGDSLKPNYPRPLIHGSYSHSCQTVSHLHNLTTPQT